MRDNLSYTFGRVCAVATKPLSLFVANNFLTAQTAQGLAVAFLASSLAMIGIGAGPHRRFYARYFATDVRVNGLTFYLYALSVILLSTLGSLVVFAMVLHFTHSTALSAAGVLFFLSEKTADEVLRLRLFEQNFGAWGAASVARSALNLAGLVVWLIVFRHDTPAWLAVITFCAGNLIVFGPHVPRHLWQHLRWNRLPVLAWTARRAFRSLLENWILWVIALLGSAVAYVDRMVALVLDKATLPLFMLVVMCFSIVQMAVDFYYVSRYRRQFLEQRIRITDVFSQSHFVRSVTGGVALAAAGSAVALLFSRNGATFPLGYVFAIAGLQVSIAIAAIPMEILYWSRKLHRILHIEVAFWVLFAAVVLLSWEFRFPTTGILAFAAACALTRLALYVMTAARLVPTTLNPTSMTT
jgi:hypothetical protein